MVCLLCKIKVVSSTVKGFNFVFAPLKFPCEVLRWVGDVIWLISYFIGRMRRVLVCNLCMVKVGDMACLQGSELLVSEYLVF